MYTQVFDPVSQLARAVSLFARSALVTLFVLLGGLKLKAQWAALIALGVALLVAVIVYACRSARRC